MIELKGSVIKAEELKSAVIEAEELKGAVEVVPGTDDDKAYILVDEDGVELAAVRSDEKIDLTATANDIRLGATAVTDIGIIEGTKEIPAYHTSEGYKVITAGSAIKITNAKDCEYTKLQALICAFNSSIANSVATEKVSVDNKVYAVNSTETISTITIDVENSTINLGITNEGTTPLIIRYFMYKEIY